jgi:predicted naringenin-chalcone synthase
MINYVDHHVTDLIMQRKFRLLAREESISKKQSVIPDFCGVAEIDQVLFKGVDPYPSTSKRMEIYQEEASNIAMQVAQNTLSKAQYFAQEITHIITVSCTGLMAPGLETILTEKLGLSDSTFRYAVNFMGCYASFHALRLGDHICKSNETAKVLIVSVELCTLHYRIDPSNDNVLSTYLFGDGSGACVMHNHLGRGKNLNVVGFNSLLVSSGKSEMGWYIGNNGFEMILSSKVAKSIESNIYTALLTLLEKNNLKIDKIDHFAIHPGGKNILKAFESALSIPQEALSISYDILRNHGNMSSATILFVLEALMNQNENLSNDQTVLSAAFGPGLTVESGLFRIA